MSTEHSIVAAQALVDDFENADHLFKFLGTPTFEGLPNVPFNAKVSRSKFFENANSMSEFIKKKYFKEPSGGLVVFKDTTNKVPRGHVTETQCRPNITAAFKDDFSNNDTTFWSCIRMAGEWASRGSNPEVQEAEAISDLHYLLLARPDLYVAQGMLASEDSMMFLVGIGGFGVRRLTIRWDDERLSELLYACIYRTYDPGHFADSSYKLDPIVDEDDPRHRSTWTITIGVKSREIGGATPERLVPCPNFLPLYASSPFGTRTHVFAAKGEGVDVDAEKLTILNDQVCRIHNRFDEHEILELVHKSKTVPGVIEVVYHKSIKLPSQLDDLGLGRVKHRHGLRQLGRPFASIPTVKEMLKVAFDIVEVLRFLRTERNILHRDISIGNVMYAPPSEDKQDPDTSTQDYEDLFFSDYFLSDSPRRPHKTSVLLVDFNHAEHLTSKTECHHERVERTGTAVFMARAVEQGKPVAIPKFKGYQFLSPIPSAPNVYAQKCPDTRLKKFPETPMEVFTKAINSAPSPWRHELDHDIESVFWLMLYWAMTAQPKDVPAERIAGTAWSSLTKKVKERQNLLRRHTSGEEAEGTIHSTFEPLNDLFQQLAEILSSIDRHWLHASETRNNPEYFAEAFQRLILRFLIEHGDHSFMNHRIGPNPRKPEQDNVDVPRSSTTSQILHASSQAKRASNTDEQSGSKRRRTTQEPQTDRNSEN